jgi:beta-phosphoglucomutase family hydrolase
MPLSAVIFDWDGVIIDSHDQHEKSWVLLAAELGRSITTEQFNSTFGQRNETIIPKLGWAKPGDTARIEKLARHKEELYRKLVVQDGIQPLAGVIQTLCALRDHGIPCAVGTSTPRENVDCVLELTGLSEFFSAIISSEDVTNGKPDPEVFLKAALALATPPEECLVFEDAPVGVAAAKQANMKAVALTTTHPADAFAESSPDLVTSDLRHLPINALEELFD